MAMPGRIINSSSYRYSINGQEKEKEVNENITSAEFWMYDSRIARRWNVDPRPNISISPYNVFAGNPIWYSDPNGDTTIQGENYENTKNGGVLGGVTVTAKVNSTNINKRFVSTFTAFVANKQIIDGIEKLLEGTGVRLADAQLSRFRFLGAASGIASLPFTLSSDNMSEPERVRLSDATMNELLQAGDLAGLKEHVENWNSQPRNQQNRIVFRYMSVGEFSNRITPDDGKAVAPPFDRSGNLAVKFITHDFYYAVNSAKTYLALPSAPEIAIWTYETKILATKMPAGPGRYQTVKPKYGEPGGGNEATIIQPFPIHGFFPLLKK
jgi:hypothetical protein